VEEIADIYLRNMARDSLNETAARLTLDDLNADRSSFMSATNKSFQQRAAAKGITAQGLTLIGAFRYPPNIVAAMNAKLEAVQHALRVENEVKQTQWEQQKLIVQSEAAVQVAKNNATATEEMGKALAANPAVLEKLKIDKWDGHYPQYMGAGNAVPMIQVGK
jgi:prohibitin 2